MILLLHGDASQLAVLVRAELAKDLPPVMGDRVQLQQVLMNLMMNSIDAMKDIDGTRRLTIQSVPSENGQVLISVSDTGVRLPRTMRTRYLMRSLLPRPTARAWDCRSAAPLLNRTGPLVGCR
jgi:C4-dicarboxylate-specific signal transduction histidine kinase